MLFLLENVVRPGVTRDQIVSHFTHRLNPATWDLVRNGVLSNVVYKTGRDAGFVAMLNVPSHDDAEALVRKAVETLDLFDVRIVQVNQFPHFD